MKLRIDGDLIDTGKATRVWNESTYSDGANRISVNTGSQWSHETLYQSAKGRYYIIHESAWQGSSPSGRFVTPTEAAQWLIMNDEEDDMPDELRHLVNEAVE